MWAVQLNRLGGCRASEELPDCALDSGSRVVHSALVGDAWRAVDTADRLDAREAAALIRSRLAKRLCETWLQSEFGELLAIVTNGERAMVMLLDEPGDARRHAIDRSAESSTSGGFLLDNGQVDRYPDRDTVPLAVAIALVTAVIDGQDLTAEEWQIDR